jgi:hypothetical protein
MANSGQVLKKDWGNIANGSQSQLNGVALAELDVLERAFVRPIP